MPGRSVTSFGFRECVLRSKAFSVRTTRRPTSWACCWNPRRKRGVRTGTGIGATMRRTSIWRSSSSRSRISAMHNQLNGALYDDHSLWVVPGSHNREDTAEERAAFPIVPPPGPALTDAMTPTERERACLEYSRKMPGAIPVVLFAGDVAFYRACQWHIGNYVPYTKRATLHDGFYGPADQEWRATVRRWQAEARDREGGERVRW